MAMSPEHKEALAKGRVEARDIKAYLAALGSRKPGRPVTTESLKAKVATLRHKIATETDPLRAVDLRQSRLVAERALANLAEPVDLDRLEQGFVASAGSYSDRKGISYAAWREAGVPAAALRKASISRAG